MFIFQISAEHLLDGTFRPLLEIRQNSGFSSVFHQVVIKEVFTSLDSALRQAEKHAFDEAGRMCLASKDFSVVKM